jgi:hypothetical protein
MNEYREIVEKLRTERRAYLEKFSDIDRAIVEAL